MSSDNDRCFQCQETGHMACYCPIYNALTVINMDTLPWIVLIKYHHQAHQHAAEVTPLIGMIGHPLDIIVTPDALTMIIKIGPGLFVPHPTHTTMDIGVAAITTPIETAPGHPTDLHDVVSHATEAQAHTTTAMTHHTTDLHPIEIFSEMTADLDTSPKNNIINWQKSLLQAHKQHHGRIETEDTNKSQLMIHHLNTTVLMIKIVTPRMI